MKKNAMTATQKAIQKAEEKLRALLQKQTEIKQQISEQTKLISNLKEQDEQETAASALKELKAKGLTAANLLALATKGDEKSLREMMELITGESDSEDTSDDTETFPDEETESETESPADDSDDE